MTDTLTTAVGNVITRLLVLERVAVPDAVNAVKAWYWREQQVPFFVNRPGALVRQGPTSPKWTQNITARLVVAEVGAIYRADGSGQTAQDNAWEYIPDVIRYFETNKHLAPSGYAAIKYLAPEGITITCPRGMDVFNLPGTDFVALNIDFELIVPYQIFE